MDYITMAYTDERTGASGNFWIVTRVEYCTITHTYNCDVSLYVSSATYQAGKSPILKKRYEFSFEPGGTFSSLTVYADVMSETDFSGGTLVEA